MTTDRFWRFLNQYWAAIALPVLVVVWILVLGEEGLKIALIIMDGMLGIWIAIYFIKGFLFKKVKGQPPDKRIVKIRVGILIALVAIIPVILGIRTAVETLGITKAGLIVGLILGLFLIRRFRSDASIAFWEQVTKERNDWWKETSDRPVIGSFLKYSRRILKIAAITTILAISWINRPWGILLILVLGYTLWRTHNEFLPATNFGSNIKGKPYRHYWTGYLVLGIRWEPVLAIPGEVWVITTLLFPFTILPILERLSSRFLGGIFTLTPLDVRFWLGLGFLCSFYWIHWTAGLWRRSGFVLTEAELYQCIPSRVRINSENHPVLAWILSMFASLISPLATNTASINLDRIAISDGTTGSLGGKKYDPGLAYQSTAQTKGSDQNPDGENVNGLCVDPQMIEDINRVREKLQKK
jgi:hypothetical protein